MKTVVLLLFATGACRLFAGDANPQPLDFDSAIKVLTTTKASPYNAWMAATAMDPQIKTKLGKLLAEQTAAVAVLRDSHKQIDLKILVPFLGFTTDATNSGMIIHDTRDDSPPKDNMDARRKKWPVFALILDMPNAAESLEKYCMDSNNPAHYRVDACHVLSYLDKERTMKVANALTTQFQSSLGRSTYIPYIDRILKGAGGSGFNGPVDDFDKTGFDNDEAQAF